MKKKYQSTSIFSIKVLPSQMISSSVIISGDANIGFGGDDDDGSIVPEAREIVWDDGWE